LSGVGQWWQPALHWWSVKAAERQWPLWLVYRWTTASSTSSSSTRRACVRVTSPRGPAHLPPHATSPVPARYYDVVCTTRCCSCSKLCISIKTKRAFRPTCYKKIIIVVVSVITAVHVYNKELYMRANSSWKYQNWYPNKCIVSINMWCKIRRLTNTYIYDLKDLLWKSFETTKVVHFRKKVGLNIQNCLKIHDLAVLWLSLHILCLKCLFPVDCVNNTKSRKARNYVSNVIFVSSTHEHSTSQREIWNIKSSKYCKLI